MVWEVAEGVIEQCPASTILSLALTHHCCSVVGWATHPGYRSFVMTRPRTGSGFVLLTKSQAWARQWPRGGACSRRGRWKLEGFSEAAKPIQTPTSGGSSLPQSKRVPRPAWSSSWRQTWLKTTLENDLCPLSRRRPHQGDRVARSPHDGCEHG